MMVIFYYFANKLTGYSRKCTDKSVVKEIIAALKDLLLWLCQQITIHMLKHSFIILKKYF